MYEDKSQTCLQICFHMLQIKNLDANLTHLPTTLLVLHLMNFSDSTCHVGCFLPKQGQTTFTFYRTKTHHGQYTAVFLNLFHIMTH